MSDKKIKIGITFGDVNGIGCEIVLKTLSDSRMAELFTPVIYGSPKVISHYKKATPGTENFQYSLIGSAADAKAKRVNLVNCLDENIKIEAGQSTPEAGKASVEALEKAVADLKAGLIDIIVTGPINKENVQSDEFPFTGHTEYFAANFGGEPVMMMCSDLMKVGLVTTHLPLGNVSAAISKERINGQLARLNKSLIEDFGVVKPKIAVLALNPHAGDGGLLGDEEETIIKPAIKEAVECGILAFGPFPADGFFASTSYHNYDAVLAMYHDQGLTPFKALTPQGVNYTAGLPVVRTSPDHGVAYDIAGHGVADESSMREAIYLGMDILRKRRNYSDITSNPLRRYEREKGADISVRDLIPETEPED